MGALNEFLQTKGIYTLVMILFFLGVYGMVLSKNYMKKLMAMNVMQVAVIFFFLCLGQKEGGMIPIFDPVQKSVCRNIGVLYQSAAPLSDADGDRCQSGYNWCGYCFADADQRSLRLR